MRGSDRMHALYLHFTDAPLSDYARAGNHSAALQITFIFYSAEICMISKSRNSSPDPIELNSGWCVQFLELTAGSRRLHLVRALIQYMS